MPTKTYKLYSSATSTTNGAASLKITRKGTIRSICITQYGTAGAAVNGVLAVEIAKQNVGSFATNDTPPVVICYGAARGEVNAGAIAGSALNAGLDVPVDVGDTLYMNVALIGTGPTAMNNIATIQVEE